jgi:hypothetical protein
MRAPRDQPRGERLRPSPAVVLQAQAWRRRAILFGALGSWLWYTLAHAEEDELRARLARFYDGRAIEERAACAHPRMLAIIDTEVVERGLQYLVLKVGYRYRDESGGMRAQRPGADAECDGSSERTFTLARTGGSELEVESMTGPQRNW